MEIIGSLNIINPTLNSDKWANSHSVNWDFDFALLSRSSYQKQTSDLLFAGFWLVLREFWLRGYDKQQGHVSKTIRLAQLRYTVKEACVNLQGEEYA